MTIRSIDFGLLADQGDELARHAAVEYLVFSDLSSDQDSLDQDSRAPSSSSEDSSAQDSSAQARQRDTWLDSTESLSQSGVSGVSSSLNDIRGDFRVGATIAQGGMGRIQLAHQVALEREVVIKSLRDGQRSRQKAQAMIKEARVAGKLEHPNIIPIHTLCWSEEEGPAIVMKRVDGVSWSALLKDPDHPTWLAISQQSADHLTRHFSIFERVCRAVEFAHSRGVIHRDIKPDNVMVGAFGEVYLLDWGVALESSTDEPPDVLVGTPAYMAPEMVNQHEPVDHRADIFLLGATLHRVVTGDPLYSGSTVVETLASALKAERFVYPESVPDELQEICLKACASEVAARHQSAAELREELERFIQHRRSIQITQDAALRLETLTLSLDAGRSAQRALSEEERLDEMITVHRAFSACRATYEQALSEWPQNDKAQRGLKRCIIEMIKYELRLGNASSAALLLAELESPPPELTSALDQLQDDLNSQREARAQLTDLKRDRRMQGQLWWRSITTLLNSVVVSGMLITISSWMRHGVINPSLMDQIYYLLGCTLVQACLILYFKRYLLDNKSYTRLMMTLGSLGPMLCLNRVFAIILGSEMPQVLSGDFLACCVYMVMLSLFSASFFWVGVVLSISASVLGLIYLPYALDFIGVSYLIHGIYIAWVLRPNHRVHSEF